MFSSWNETQFSSAIFSLLQYFAFFLHTKLITICYIVHLAPQDIIVCRIDAITSKYTDFITLGPIDAIILARLITMISSSSVR